MKKLKVVTVVGTRPEIIRLSRVLAALDNSSAVEHFIIHTGQNYDYELNGIFFEELGIRSPDFFLNAAGNSVSATIGQILINIDPILEQIMPDALVVLGDTNSCLCAIPAKKRHIPIFHMEAGNRCFDQRVPEETNRKIVDHIADINITYSSIAREYLLREGIPADRIIKSGSPMFEVLNYYSNDIRNSKVLERLNLFEKGYFLVSSHREENVSNLSNFKKLIDSLNNIADKYNKPIIFSTHPRTRKIIDSEDFNMHPNIVFLKPLGFIDYNMLQMNAFVVLSDSGTISEESSILNFSALNIREAHERPEAMEEAAVMMVGLNKERIIQGIEQLSSERNTNERLFRQVADYSMNNVSDKIVRIIISYTEYVKRTVWSE